MPSRGKRTNVVLPARRRRASLKPLPHPQSPKKIKLQTGDLCMVCFRQCDSPVRGEQFEYDREELGSKFIRMSSRYLKMNLSAREGSFKQHGWHRIDHGGFQITACDNCLPLMASFCDNYAELEKTKLKLDFDVDKMRSIMKCAEKVPTRNERFESVFKEKEAMNEKMIVCGFRQQFIEKGKWKRLESPQVIVERDSSLWKEGQLKTQATSDETDLQQGRELVLPLQSSPPNIIDGTGSNALPKSFQKEATKKSVTVLPLTIQNSQFTVDRIRNPLLNSKSASIDDLFPEKGKTIFEKVSLSQRKSQDRNMNGVRSPSLKACIMPSSKESQENEASNGERLPNKNSKPVNSDRKLPVAGKQKDSTSVPEIVVLESDDEIEFISETMNSLPTERSKGGITGTSVSSEKAVMGSQKNEMTMQENISEQGRNGGLKEGQKNGADNLPPKLPQQTPMISKQSRPRPRAMPLSARRKQELVSFVPPIQNVNKNDERSSENAVDDVAEVTSDTPIRVAAFTPSQNELNSHRPPEVSHVENGSEPMDHQPTPRTGYPGEAFEGVSLPNQTFANHGNHVFVEGQDFEGNEGSFHGMPHQPHNHHGHSYAYYEEPVEPPPILLRHTLSYTLETYTEVVPRENFPTPPEEGHAYDFNEDPIYEQHAQSDNFHTMSTSEYEQQPIVVEPDCSENDDLHENFSSHQFNQGCSGLNNDAHHVSICEIIDENMVV